MPVFVGSVIGLAFRKPADRKPAQQLYLQEIVDGFIQDAVSGHKESMLCPQSWATDGIGYIALQGHIERALLVLKVLWQKNHRREEDCIPDARTELRYALHFGIIHLRTHRRSSILAGRVIDEVALTLSHMQGCRPDQVVISDHYRRLLVDEAEMEADLFQEMPAFVERQAAPLPLWNFATGDFGVDFTRPASLPSEAAPAVARLDAYLVRDLERAVFELVRKANSKIEQAPLDGSSEHRWLPLNALYINLIADPTSSEEHRRALEVDDAAEANSQRLPGTWKQMLGPSQTKAERQVRKEESPAPRKPRRAPPRPPPRPDMSLSDQIADAVQESADAEAQARAAEPAGLPEGETLHSVLRRERCCVVLGDPGSGKTVLCRWIAKELATCQREGRESRELGPARTPFLIPARNLIDGNMDGIVAYLRSAARPPLRPGLDEAWNGFVDQRLADGKLFVIVDGLDEVAVDKQGALKGMIDSFVTEHVAKPGLADVRPDTSLGNQILVTSRITGYYQTALNSKVWSTFLIRPLSDAQIAQFCDNWCKAADAARLAAPLKIELFAAENASILPMARNPLLLSILCRLGILERTAVHLPRARATLYEQVIVETAARWRAQAIEAVPDDAPAVLHHLSEVDPLLALFAPVAMSMHRDWAAGEIEEEELLDRLVRAIAGLEGRHVTTLTPDEEEERRDFLRVRVDQVFGIMSERSRGRYSFLHRTFQEYLAGISLLLPEPAGKPIHDAPFAITAAALADKIISGGLLVDPHWRQPLLLLLGQLAHMGEQRALGLSRPAPELMDVIGALDRAWGGDYDRMSAEDWALFLADLLAELPDSFIFGAGGTDVLLPGTAGQLLDSYARLGPDSDAAHARQSLTERLAEVRRRIGPAAFERIVIRSADSGGAARLSAAAHLFLQQAWLSQSIVDAFDARRHLDDGRWSWPIHRLLRIAATDPPLKPLLEPLEFLVPPAPGNARATRHYHNGLPAWQNLSTAWAERNQLEAPLVSAGAREVQDVLARSPLDPGLADPFEAIATLAALGGLGDYEARPRADTYQDYVDFLSLPDSARQSSIERESWRYIPWFGAEDPVYAMAVLLDTKGPDYRRVPAPAARPAMITGSGTMALTAASALAGRNSVRAALGALNPPELPPGEKWTLAAIQRLTSPPAAARAAIHGDPLPPPVLAELERLGADLADPCYRGAVAVRDWLIAQMPDADEEDWLLAYRSFASAWAASGRPGINGTQAPGGDSSPDAHAPLGEHWALGFAARGDDPRMDFAHRLDNDWRPQSPADIQAMMRAVARAHGLETQNASMPDLFDLGTGALPLPPIGFYGAANALGALVAARLGADLQPGWISVALGPLIGVDPIAEHYRRTYAPLEQLPADPRKWARSVPAALRDWREALDSLSFRGSEQNDEALARQWWRAWEAAKAPAARLLLARDAVGNRLDRDGEILGAIRDLVAQAPSGLETEAALLAGQLARERADPEWLALGLHCLAGERDGRWRAEAIQAFAPLVGAIGGPAEAGLLDSLAAGLRPRDLGVARGETAAWLRSWIAGRWPEAHGLRCALAATLIVLEAAEESARARSRGRAPIAALWRALADAIGDPAPQTSKVGAAIDAIIEAAPARGLPLSEEAAQALDRVATSAEAADAAVERLLPLIEHVPRTMIAKARAWRDSDGHAGAATRRSNPFAEALREHAALWLAETESRFSPRDLKALIGLLDHGDDRSAARTRLLLHGEQTGLGNRPHRYSLAELKAHDAAATVEALARLELERGKIDRSGWSLSEGLLEWRIDDPDAVGRWLKRLTNDPADAVALRVLLWPWRWSADCLALWSRWVDGIEDPALLNAAAVWLGILHVAAEHGMRADMVPPLPAWRPDRVPDLEWLPRQSADSLALEALANAFADVAPEAGIAALADAADQAMRINMRSLRGALEDEGAITADDYLSLGHAVSQLIGETPETALGFMSEDGWTDSQVAALALWTRRRLLLWHPRRFERHAVDHYDNPLCASLLSILSCLLDRWPNAVRIALTQPAREGEAGAGIGWAELLTDVIRFFPNDRIPQAAWTLLGAIVGPDLPPGRLWSALACSMRAKPIIRDRALATLSSLEGRKLVMAIPQAAIEVALDQWEREPSGQMILVMAQLFATIAREPLVDPALRRRIHGRLKAIARQPLSRRPLYRLVGTGGNDLNRYLIVKDGMLDAALREVERGLLIAAV
jgi:hypothetical protein